MHLAQMLALRTVPAAGLLLALTQRCPLSCAHCISRSSMDAAEYGEEPFRALVDSFGPTDRPELIFMSGGEPLLRPGLVRDLAVRARRSGTRSAALSGMFFARNGSIPQAIKQAVAALDHFSASLDVHHEREVSRANVFTALDAIMDTVPAVSLHVTGTGEDDPYVVGLLSDLRRRFGTRVPVLVTGVLPAGRASGWVAVPQQSTRPDPCEFAAWPLVDYDGQVIGCCQQNLVRAHRPPHLMLGHGTSHSWARLRDQSRGRPLLRSIRAYGPLETARRSGGGDGDSGICATCVKLTGDDCPSPAVEAVAHQLLSRLRPRDLARRWGAGRHSDLVEAGWNPCDG